MIAKAPCQASRRALVLAVASLAALAPAAAEPPPLPDLPATHVQTRRWVGRPLHLLLRQWSEESGIPLTVSPELSIQKVTVELPAGSTLRRAGTALASLLSAEWVRSGEKDGQEQKPGFMLRESEIRRNELRERDRHERALRDEAAREQAALILKAIDRAVAEVGRPPRKLAEGVVGRPYINPEAESLASLLGTLTPAQRQHLARSPSHSINTANGTLIPQSLPALSTPIRSLSPVQQRHLQEFALSRGITTDLSSGVVQFINRDGLTLSVRIQLPDGSQVGDLAVIADEGKAAKRLSAPGSGAQPANRMPDSETIPKDLLRRLQQRPPIRGDWGEADYGEAVRRLGSELGIAVVADYYTLPNRLALVRPQVQSAELLAAVLRAFDCEARWDGEVLLLRSRQWPLLDRREIAEELLLRWVEEKRQRPRNAPPHLDQLGEMADTLRVEQFACLSEFRPRDVPGVEFIFEGPILRFDRDFLALWARLTPGQRRGVLGPGLPLREIGPTSLPAAQGFLQRKVAGWFPAADTIHLVLRLVPDVAPGERHYVLELAPQGASPASSIRIKTSIPAPATPN